MEADLRNQVEQLGGEIERITKELDKYVGNFCHSAELLCLNDCSTTACTNRYACMDLKHSRDAG